MAGGIPRAPVAAVVTLVARVARVQAAQPVGGEQVAGAGIHHGLLLLRGQGTVGQRHGEELVGTQRRVVPVRAVEDVEAVADIVPETGKAGARLIRPLAAITSARLTRLIARGIISAVVTRVVQLHTLVPLVRCRMEADTREMVLEELHDLPDAGLFEVLDFVRFLKFQWSSMSTDERFDRAWMAARRVGAELGITDQDIRAETEKVRRKRR